MQHRTIKVVVIPSFSYPDRF